MRGTQKREVAIWKKFENAFQTGRVIFQNRKAKYIWLKVLKRKDYILLKSWILTAMASASLIRRESGI